MSYELINRISIKKDRVYVSTRSNNDTAPYYSREIPFLTENYKKGGQKALDREIVNMCLEYCRLRGSHKSIMPYKSALDLAYNNKDFLEILNNYRKIDDKCFDIRNGFGDYKNLSREEREELYNKTKPSLDKLRFERNSFVADLVKEFRIKELEKEINYEKRKMEVCAYGRSDIYYLRRIRR